MTELEMIEIEMNIMNDNDKIIDCEYTNNVFYPDGMLVKRTTTSLVAGYQLVEDFIYAEAYNIEGILGGYALQEVKTTFIQLGGEN